MDSPGEPTSGLGEYAREPGAAGDAEEPVRKPAPSLAERYPEARWAPSHRLAGGKVHRFRAAPTQPELGDSFGQAEALRHVVLEKAKRDAIYMKQVRKAREERQALASDEKKDGE